MGAAASVEPVQNPGKPIYSTKHNNKEHIPTYSYEDVNMEMRKLRSQGKPIIFFLIATWIQT
jgi:hypothetical protein